MIFETCVFELRDGTQCTLRSPRASDAPAMMDFLHAVAGESPYLLRYPDEVDRDYTDEDRKLEEEAASPDSMMIEAFVEDRIVGGASIRCVYKAQKTRHRGEFSIAILERFCGKGLGTRLSKECIAASEAIGFEQLELGVFADNSRAMSLYRKLGFSEYGRMPNAFKMRDGSYCDDITMMMPLARHPGRRQDACSQTTGGKQ